MKMYSTKALDPFSLLITICYLYFHFNWLNVLQKFIQARNTFPPFAIIVYKTSGRRLFATKAKEVYEKNIIHPIFYHLTTSILLDESIFLLHLSCIFLSIPSLFHIDLMQMLNNTVDETNLHIRMLGKLKHIKLKRLKEQRKRKKKSITLMNRNGRGQEKGKKLLFPISGVSIYFIVEWCVVCFNGHD